MPIKKTNVNSPEYKTVIIPKPNNVVGDTETVVGINGKMYQIQYDKPVSVPLNVAEVIEQSNYLKAEISDRIDDSIFRPGKPSIADL